MRLEYRVSPRLVGLFLGSVAVYLAFQSLLFEYLVEVVIDKQAHPYIVTSLDLFSVNTEQTIPTWYSSLLLFAAALLFLLVSVGKSGIIARGRWLWTSLAVIFLYLSLDEAASIHEIAAKWLQTDFELSGFWTFGWQLAALPFLALFGLIYFRFWWRLPRATRLHFMVAGVVYVGGAFVVEGISAARWDALGGLSYGYLVIATVEELCEMLGVVILIYGLLTYLVNEGYTLAFMPPNSIEPRKFRPSRPMRLLIGSVLALNALVIAWTVNLSGESLNDDGIYMYHSLIDQLAVDGVIVGREIGRFSFDNPASETLPSLAETFSEIMVVNLISADSYLILAAEQLPFTQDQVIDVLHNNGETQFIIFDDNAVRLILRQVAR